MQEVCKEYKIDISGLEGKRGSENEAGKIAMYLISVKTGLSNKEIAFFFENVHYGTISQMRKRVEKNTHLLKKSAGIFDNTLKLSQVFHIMQGLIIIKHYQDPVLIKCFRKIEEKRRNKDSGNRQERQMAEERDNKQ